MNKTSALRIRVEPALHRDFVTICKSIDKPAAQVLREFMRSFVENHNKSLQPDLFKVNDQREGT